MQDFVNIVSLSSQYCLIGCGYVLIYKASRVVNLAHGEIMAFGGYFLYTMSMGLGKHPIASFVITFLLSLALGFFVYFFLMRLMAGESIFAAVLVTIALGIFLRGLIVMIWTANPRHPLQYFGIENSSFEIIGGAVISTFGSAMVLAAALVYLLLFFWFKFSRYGLMMRAVGEKPLLASQRGMEPHRFYALSWGIAAVTGGLAGMIQFCDTGIDTDMFIVGLKVFPVVLVGGLDSLVGVILGAFIVASAEVFTIKYITPLASEVAPFVVLLAMLMVRPWGLLGSREEWERV